MKTYPEYLVDRLHDAVFNRDRAQRDLEFVVDDIAFRLEDRMNEELRQESVMIHGSIYKVAHVSYCAGDTRDDNYRNVTFEVYLVAENFEDFHLESEEARVCGAALHRALTDGEVIILAGMSVDEHSAVIAYDKTVPVSELPDLNFSGTEIKAYFADIN